MVEGGRLEIVLAVLNCHVGSNPTLSAIFYDLFYMLTQDHPIKQKSWEGKQCLPNFFVFISCSSIIGGFVLPVFS